MPDPIVAVPKTPLEELQALTGQLEIQVRTAVDIVNLLSRGQVLGEALVAAQTGNLKAKLRAAFLGLAETLIAIKAVLVNL